MDTIPSQDVPPSPGSNGTNHPGKSESESINQPDMPAEPDSLACQTENQESSHSSIDSRPSDEPAHPTSTPEHGTASDPITGQEHQADGWLSRELKIILGAGGCLGLGLIVVLILLAGALIPLTKTRSAADYINRGWEQYNQGNLDEAVSLFTQAIQFEPDNGEAYIKRGITYAAKNYLVVAIDDFSKAIELDPNDPAAYYDRGIAYYSKSDAPHAISDFDKAIQLDPGDAGAYLFRGIVYAAKHDLDQAITDFNQAIKLDPNNGDAYYCRGMAYNEQGKKKDAMIDFNRALELCGDDSYLCQNAQSWINQLEEE